MSEPRATIRLIGPLKKRTFFCGFPKGSRKKKCFFSGQATKRGGECIFKPKNCGDFFLSKSVSGYFKT